MKDNNIKSFDEEFPETSFSDDPFVGEALTKDRQRLKAYIHTILDSLKVELKEGMKSYNTCAKEVNQAIEKAKQKI